MSELPRPLVFIGGVALLAAVGFDTVAVIGRHVGLPLRGSIELVQASVLVAGSIALLAATLGRNHAGVHLLTDRAGVSLKDRMLRGGTLLTALFIAGTLSGSIWLSLDLWRGHEVSELLGISYKALRLFANLCVGGVLAALLWQALGPKRT